MKLKPCSCHVYENIESASRSTIKSGLATLPTNKNKSSQQVQHSSFPKEYQKDCGQLSISHTRESSSHTIANYRHFRQSFINTLYAGNQQQSRRTIAAQKQSSKEKTLQTKKPQQSSKPPKPVKPEKKKRVVWQQEESKNVPEQNQQLSPTHDNNMSYINRKMMEGVLSYQNRKLASQGSNVSNLSHSSNTSFDSDTSSVKSHKDSTGSDIPCDTAFLESHRDSGYGSTGQRTFDTGHETDNYHTSGVNSNKVSIHSGHLDQNQSMGNSLKHPSRLNDQSTAERKQLYNPAIAKSHMQDIVCQEKLPDGKSLVHQYLGQETPKNQQGYCDVSLTEDFERLCQKSEELMDQCMLVETSENASDALTYCNAAIDCLKQAMRITACSQSQFVKAQKMHNACVLKAMSLQKEFVIRQESTSSTMSSDSARSSTSVSLSSSDYSFQNQNHRYFGGCCAQRTCKQFQSLYGTHSMHGTIHLRSSSQDSIDSVIENKNYRKENRTSDLGEQSINTSEFSSNASISSSERTLQSSSSSMNNIDIYATLPRKGRKSSKGSSSSQDPEVYKKNLGRQKSLNGEQHGRIPNSRSITPTPVGTCNRDSDFSNEEADYSFYYYQLQSPAQEQVRANRGEIRQLQHNSGGQCHLQVNHIPYTPKNNHYSCPLSFDQPQHQYHQGQGLQQNEVCKSTPQHTARAHPALPTKQPKAVVSTKQKQQQVKPEIHSAKQHRQLSNEDSSSSRPLTPQSVYIGGHSNDSLSEPEEFQPRVRYLASKSEQIDDSNRPTRVGHTSRSTVCVPVGSGLDTKQSNKFESDFRKMQLKPKSALSRHKKSPSSRARKFVTFSDNIALVDTSDLFPPVMPCSNDKNSDYVSNEEERYHMTRGLYLDNDDDDSADSPIDIYAGEVACNLCVKKDVRYDQQYCEKCYVYMSQFQKPW